MEGLKISIADLSRQPKEKLAASLKDTIQTAGEHVELVRILTTETLPECAVKTSDLFTTDLLFLIPPDTIGDRERELISSICTNSLRTPVIAVIEDPEMKKMLELFRLGVADFITLPLKTADVMARVWRLTALAGKKKILVHPSRLSPGLHRIIGESPAFVSELQKISFIADYESSVLITGETGTGKEIFARAIHDLGRRADKPFTAINCGALPAELLENELFGHARGAFTSAATSEKGMIHETDGGTLFLDEIDSLALAAQVKLLRFLQEKEYRQLGSAKTIRADVRIVAATNIDLEQAVEESRFRRDLYYRLNIIPLRLPPLRERREDIPLLARHFIAQYSKRFGKPIPDIAPEAMTKLLACDWPGNVRQLQNIIERAMIFSPQKHLMPDDIHLPKTKVDPEESFQRAKARVIDDFEKSYILRLLALNGGNISQAARTAGKNRRVFWELMRKHDIRIDKFALP